MNYEEIAKQVAKLLQEKNEAYGDAINRTAKILEILYPTSIQIKDYVNVLLITRICDKLCRESVTPAKENAEDLAGYGLRMLAEYTNARDVVKSNTTPTEFKLGNEGEMYCSKCNNQFYITADSNNLFMCARCGYLNAENSQVKKWRIGRRSHEKRESPYTPAKKND